MLKKIIGLTIVALCFMNSSFAELQHFPMYGEHQLCVGEMFTQLNGITLNGLTAEQARDKAYVAARQEASQYLGSEEALKSHFNAMAKTQKVQELAKRHEELSHITARSSYKKHKTPFDFVEVMGDYIHWIPGPTSEETCEHRSYGELKEHAEVYTALLMVRMMILQNPQQMDSYMNTKDKVKEIFSKHYDTALAPFFDAKKATSTSLSFSAILKFTPPKALSILVCIEMTHILFSMAFITVRCTSVRSLIVFSPRNNRG